MALVIQFLTQIRNFVRDQNGDELQSWLQVAPDANQQYHQLAAELRSQYRAQGLDKIVEQCLPQDDDVEEGKATSWPGLVAFLRDYFAYWRDANFDDLLGTHQRLSGLVK
jgi:nuclear mRNA export protein PCID2/THP1